MPRTRETGFYDAAGSERRIRDSRSAVSRHSKHACIAKSADQNLSIGLNSDDIPLPLQVGGDLQNAPTISEPGVNRAAVGEPLQQPVQPAHVIGDAAREQHAPRGVSCKRVNVLVVAQRQKDMAAPSKGLV